MFKKKEKLLSKESKRTTGKNASKSNIEGAILLSKILKTTLGPNGLDKMLIDPIGNTVITNDGAKILKEMKIEHPGAKIIVDIAKTQESEIGDGTTSIVLLSGEILKRSKVLLNKNIHPTNIIKNFELAKEKAKDILEENSIKIKSDNEKVLIDLCQTAITGKVAENYKKTFSKIILELVKNLKEKNSINRENLKIEKIKSKDFLKSNIIKGLILNKNLAHPNMPKQIKNGNILLLNLELNIEETNIDSNVNLNSFQEYQNYINEQKEYLKSIVKLIKKLNVNCIFVQKDINDELAYFLAQENIIAVKRCRKTDIEKLSSALNVNIINSIDKISKKNIGKATNIELKSINNENYIFVEGYSNSKINTLILNGSNKQTLEEIERAIDDCLGDINSYLKSKKIIGGGGSIETKIYLELMKFSKQFKRENKEIIQEFAKSYLIIPKILIENLGLNSNSLEKLISLHKKNYSKAGINSNFGIKKDVIKEQIIEPLELKKQIINSSFEATATILRVDDIIAAEKLN